tara:strand:+ start:521 stop:727 length:207 start_codon:yes stop_codon:yes gene_type:complete
MWITCYKCNGSGIDFSKKVDNTIFKEENKEETCQVCNRYRTTIQGYEFYGQIWCDDYETLTPPSSPNS